MVYNVYVAILLRGRLMTGRIMGLLLVLGLAALPVSAATTTLQEGVAGYAGCVDTYIHSGAPDVNYDALGELLLTDLECVS